MNNKTTIIAIVFLAIGLVGGGLAGIKYQKNKDNTPISVCLAGDLNASMEFQGAAGNIYGTFQIMNKSNKNCQINGRNYVEANYNTSGNGNLGFIQTGLPSVDTYTLAPGQSVYALYHAPNGPQCSTGIHQVPVTFKYNTNSENVTFSDNQGNQETSVVNCNLQTDMTQITISNLSDIAPVQ